MAHFLQVHCKGAHEYVESRTSVSGSSIITSHWLCRKCGHPLNEAAKKSAEKVMAQIKGEKNGLCNRTACQAPGATYYNHSTRKYYCEPCANEINRVNRADALRMFGHDLCTLNESDE